MTDQDRVVRILRTMPDEPPAPSTIDVPRTMAEGRRRRRARRWSGGVALAAVTAVAAGGGTVAVAAMRDTPAPPPRPAPSVTTAATTAAAAPAPPVPRDCKVALLPSGGIKKALVTSGDPSGHYLAGRVYPGDGARTVLWKDGVLQSRPAMPGADATWEDINSAGVAVGSSFPSGDEQQAYVSTGATVTPLRGGPSVASAINEKGLIAGVLGSPYEGGLPVVWSSPQASPARLALPAGYAYGEANAIDEDGTVVGLVVRGNQKRMSDGTGYLWRPDGTGRLMPLPTVDGEKASFFWPESVSAGWVYGRAGHDSADGSTRSFASYRYDIARNRYEALPAPLGPPAIGAGNGWVLGTTGAYDPVLISGKKVVKLPRYKTMKEYVVSALSADGKVAAGYTTDTDEKEGVANRPVVWTCR
ncbi:hypothetical protein AB0J83_01560 [Actinoplanes sp. NPDC049596]|uniref:hypothetical protein n=1 Tax=unclassified Actinoplanes TaxID=2626549 RepID=UPI003436BCBA